MRHLIIASAAGVALFAAPASAQSEADLKTGAIVKDCDFCSDLVLVPAGEFTIGSDPALPGTDMTRGEGPQVKMKIAKPFLLAKTETTHGQFKRFVEETGYQVKLGCRVWDNEFVDKPDASWRNPYQPAKPKDNDPVGCVSWNDAQAFIAWLSQKTGKAYRLPTEAEWEYAARAGTNTLRFWGDSPDDACQWANTFDISGQEKYPFAWTHSACKDGYADVAPVGSFKPNQFGLQDMVGNVWEWMEDCYAGSHQGRPRDGRAWTWDGGCPTHSTRGGAWMSAPERNRIAWPGRDPADRHMGYFGFRVARDLDAAYAPGYEGGQIRRVTLFTGDMEKAKAFWVDALGYRVRMDNPAFGGEQTAKTLNLNEGARAHFVILEPGKTNGPLIGLMGAAGQQLDSLDRDIGAAPKSGDYIMVIKVQDIAATFAKLKQMGVKVMSEPNALTGTGGTSTVGAEGTVLSPDGTRVIIQQVDAGG